jgi:hypothetical protein
MELLKSMREFHGLHRQRLYPYQFRTGETMPLFETPLRLGAHTLSACKLVVLHERDGGQDFTLAFIHISFISLYLFVSSNVLPCHGGRTFAKCKEMSGG